MNSRSQGSSAYTATYWCHCSLSSQMPQLEQAAHLTGNLPACHLACSITVLNTVAWLEDLSLPSYRHVFCLQLFLFHRYFSEK